MKPLPEDVIKQLRENYIIVPRQLVHWWGGALVVVLAALGITSFVTFREAVVGIASAAATRAAEETAKSVAGTRAEMTAEGVVQKVFKAAQDSAARVASETATLAVKQEVDQQVRVAARAEAELVISRALGTNVLADLSRFHSEAKLASEAIKGAQSRVNRETLEGVASRTEQIEKWLAVMTIGLEHLYSHTQNRNTAALNNLVMPAYEFALARYPEVTDATKPTTVFSTGARPSPKK